MKRKIVNTYEHRNFRQLKETCPMIIAKKHHYERYESGSDYMLPFSVEWTENDVLTLMHTFTRNGDLCYDPLIRLRVDYEMETVRLFWHENSFGQWWQSKVVAEETDSDGKKVELVHSENSFGELKEYYYVPEIQRKIGRYVAGFIKTVADSEYKLTEARVVCESDDEYTEITLKYKDGEITELSGNGSTEVIKDYARKNGLLHLLNTNNKLLG